MIVLGSVDDVVMSHSSRFYVVSSSVTIVFFNVALFVVAAFPVAVCVPFLSMRYVLFLVMISRFVVDGVCDARLGICR